MSAANPFGVNPAMRASSIRQTNLPGRSVDIEPALTYREQMLPVWINELQPDESGDATQISPSLLRELYPNIFYWGVRGDAVAMNLTRMISLLGDEKVLQIPARTVNKAALDFGIEYLTVYNGLQLTKLFLKEDYKPLFEYVFQLKNRNLFEVAYRNTNPAELVAENVFANEHGTILHRYVQHEIWEIAINYPHGVRHSRDLEQVLAMFPRMMLSAPVFDDLPEFQADWAAHVAFCEKWDLTP